MPNILLLESISPAAYDLLGSAAHIIKAPAPDRGLEVIDGQDIHGIVTRGKGQVNQTLIDACTSLGAIARCGVGLDNVDVPHATSQDIKVINAPGANADTVAEHTLSLMLLAQRKIYDAITSVNDGHWADRNHYGGDEIRGKTLGIIGMGDIGRKVAKLGEAFGMNIIYWNRSDVTTDYQRVDLPELLHQAHIISIHLSLNAETSGLITADSFSKNTHRPILINTSRGGIITDAEVIRALEEGSIAAYAADVLQSEPPPSDSALLRMPHAFVTPHIASLTARTYDEMCVMTVQNLIDVLAGRDINPKYIFNQK